MPDKPIAILGCGPAGMFAAHAAAQAGKDFIIYSKNRKSFMRGAQYLHEPIPGLSGDPFKVEYKLKGTVEGYRSKVYGDMGDILVSPESLVGISPAWDIREAYDAAWDLYHEKVQDWDATNMGPSEWGSMIHDHSFIFSTIPQIALCQQRDRHQFYFQKVWATESIKSFGEFEYDSNGDLLDNLVVCSGDNRDWWYRQSRIHGWENTEFPHHLEPTGFPGRVHEVVKPLHTDCTCFPMFRRLGRYGEWKKGVLSHEAYRKAEIAIANVRHVFLDDGMSDDIFSILTGGGQA